MLQQQYLMLLNAVLRAIIIIMNKSNVIIRRAFGTARA